MKVSQETLNKFEDFALLQITGMYPILFEEYPSRALVDLAEEIHDYGKFKKVFETDLDFPKGEDDMSQLLAEVTPQHCGKLLVAVSTPVFEEGSNCFSWGHTTFSWFLADDLEEAIDKGIKWAESTRVRKPVKKKAKKKK